MQMIVCPKTLLGLIMTKSQLLEHIHEHVTSQGNQTGLSGLSELLQLIVEAIPDEAIANVGYVVNIPAFERAELTKSDAEKAGFTEQVVKQLLTAQAPTIQFQDMRITFNSLDVISDELAIWTALVYDAPNDMTYHCALYLYEDGRIFYTADTI